MNVLLIGGASKVMDTMIDKLNKSNHRIYLLTGQKGKDKERGISRKRVFEKYDFLYDSESVKDVMESVRPEIVLFMGAYDTNFEWKHHGRTESVRYTSSLINILSAYSMLGGGRFVYLSSQEVFSNSYANDIPETEKVSPKGFKALAVAQGEELCGNYRNMQDVDTVVLRLDQVYSVPQKGQEESNPCYRMCLEALKRGSISANGRNSFSMLYVNDAVELIYKVMTAEQVGQPCYHISSMEEINEMEFAQIIIEKMGAGITITDQSVGEKYRHILDGRNYQNEFGQRIFTHYPEGVGEVAAYMKRYSDSFLKSEDAGGGWGGRLLHGTKVAAKSLLPLLENLICFVILYILYDRAAGSQYFGRLDFYLLYVLLFAAIYGQQEAIFSALLASVGYCFRQTDGHIQFEILLDYNTYVWMAQLFIVGMVVGYIRDRLRHTQDDKEEELGYLYERIEDISEINDSNVRMKRNFEAQLVNHKDSLGKIYEITSSLERYETEEVLFYAAQVLGELMDSRDVALYIVANRDYARLFSATSPEARKLGNSVKYTAMGDMYHELSNGRVYINKNMEAELPLMASAVYAEDEMQLILMVWGIPWQRMTLSEANRLTVIGTLIQNASVRASRYLESLKGQRYIQGTSVLNEGAFTQLVKAFLDAKSKGLTECTLVEIVTGYQGYEQASALLESCIRQTDYMGTMEGGKLYILLSNTDLENAEGVRDRFRKLGYESLLKEVLV